MNENHGAQALIHPLPAIPDELREEAMNEAATARFQIAVDGTTTVTLVKPTQNPRLNRLLLETLKHWRFMPAIKDGNPVPSVEVMVIRLNVNSAARCNAQPCCATRSSRDCASTRPAVLISPSLISEEMKMQPAARFSFTLALKIS